jgi:hypothetical protein
MNNVTSLLDRPCRRSHHRVVIEIYCVGQLGTTFDERAIIRLTYPEIRMSRLLNPRTPARGCNSGISDFQKFRFFPKSRNARISARKIPEFRDLLPGIMRLHAISGNKNDVSSPKFSMASQFEFTLFTGNCRNDHCRAALQSGHAPLIILYCIISIYYYAVYCCIINVNSRRYRQCMALCMLLTDK